MTKVPNVPSQEPSRLNESNKKITATTGKWGKIAIQVLSTLPLFQWGIVYEILQQKKTPNTATNLNKHIIEYLNSYNSTETFFLSIPICGTVVAFCKIYKNSSSKASDQVQQLRQLTPGDLSDPAMDIAKFEKIDENVLGNLLKPLDYTNDENIPIAQNIKKIIANKGSREEKIRFFKGLMKEIKSSAADPTQASKVIEWYATHVSDPSPEGLSIKEIEQAILSAGWEHVSSINVDTRWEYACEGVNPLTYALDYLNQAPDAASSERTLGFDRKCKHILKKTIPFDVSINQKFINKLQIAIKLHGNAFFTDFIFHNATKLANAFANLEPGQDRSIVFNNINFANILLKNSRLYNETRITILSKISDNLSIIEKQETVITKEEFDILLNILKEFNKLNKVDLLEISNSEMSQKINKLFRLANELIQKYPKEKMTEDDRKGVDAIEKILNKLQKLSPDIFSSSSQPPIVEAEAPKTPTKRLSRFTASLKTGVKKRLGGLQAQLDSVTDFNNNQDVFIVSSAEFLNWMQNRNVDFTNKDLNSSIEKMLMNLPIDMRKEFIRDVAYGAWLKLQPGGDAAIAFFKLIYNNTIFMEPTNAHPSFYAWTQIPEEVSLESALEQFKKRQPSEDSAEFWHTALGLYQPTDTHEFQKAIQKVSPNHPPQKHHAFEQVFMQSPPQPLTLAVWHTWTKSEQHAFSRLLQKLTNPQLASILAQELEGVAHVHFTDKELLEDAENELNEIDGLFNAIAKQVKIINEAQEGYIQGYIEQFKKDDLNRDIEKIQLTISKLKNEEEEIDTDIKEIEEDIKNEQNEEKKNNFIVELANTRQAKEQILGKLAVAKVIKEKQEKQVKLIDDFDALQKGKGQYSPKEYQKKLTELIIDRANIESELDTNYDLLHKLLITTFKNNISYLHIDTVDKIKKKQEFLQEMAKDPQLTPLYKRVNEIQEKAAPLKIVNTFVLLADKFADRSVDLPQYVLEDSVSKAREAYAFLHLPPHFVNSLISLKALSEIKKVQSIINACQVVNACKTEPSPDLIREENKLLELQATHEELSKEFLGDIPGLVMQSVDNKGDMSEELKKINSNILICKQKIKLFKLLKNPKSDKKSIAEQLLYIESVAKTEGFFKQSDIGKRIYITPPTLARQEEVTGLSERVGAEYQAYRLAWKSFTAASP